MQKENNGLFRPRVLFFLVFFAFLIPKNRLLKGANFYSALFMMLTVSGEIPVVS
jgi:hypothetical protein